MATKTENPKQSDDGALLRRAVRLLRGELRYNRIACMSRLTLTSPKEIDVERLFEAAQILVDEGVAVPDPELDGVFRYVG